MQGLCDAAESQLGLLIALRAQYLVGNVCLHMRTGHGWSPERARRGILDTVLNGVTLVMIFAPRVARPRSRTLPAMCAQCMANASLAIGAAAGTRAWLAAWRPSWLTDNRLHRVTVCLVVVGLLVSSVALGGSGH